MGGKPWRDQAVIGKCLLQTADIEGGIVRHNILVADVRRDGWPDSVKSHGIPRHIRGNAVYLCIIK